MNQDHDGQSQIVLWGRWVSLPFAPWIASFIAQVLFMAFQWLSMKLSGGFHEDGWFWLYIIPIMGSGVAGSAFAFTAYHWAPKGKLVAGTVLTTVLGLLCAFSLFYIWVHSESSTGVQVGESLKILVALAAAILTLIIQEEENPSRKST